MTFALADLTYSQALVLYISELEQMRKLDPGVSTRTRREWFNHENVCRREFSQLEPVIQSNAIAWCQGLVGPGAEWDNRRHLRAQA